MPAITESQMFLKTEQRIITGRAERSVLASITKAAPPAGK